MLMEFAHSKNCSHLQLIMSNENNNPAHRNTKGRSASVSWVI
uniref:Uncharacterized protein n=1 Tax=Anguilla anguilla TaxID=7936 RepID=A0A0E9W128_ANGAN